MNLTEWAGSEGVHPQTAYRWFREGTLPVRAVRVNQRTVLVNPELGGITLGWHLSTTAQDELHIEEHELNGQPAVVFWVGERPFAALLLAVADGKIQRVFFHADLDRLRYVGRRAGAPEARSTRDRNTS